jgi:hypothetical protein
MQKNFIIACVCCFQVAIAQNSLPSLIAPLPNTLKENSGLCFANNHLFTVKDGKGNSFYTIDTVTGNIKNTITVINVLWEDAEAITTDGTHLYIGDFGNNDGLRTTVFVYRIALATIDFGKPQQTIATEKISIKYADQKGAAVDKNLNAFDCEAFIATNNAFYFFTKRRNDFKTQLYISYKTVGNHTAKPIDYFNCNGLITDAAYNKNTKQLVLLGYQKGHQQSFIWLFNRVTEPKFLATTPLFLSIQNSAKKEWQTEGICFINNQQLFISCEKTDDYGAGLYRYSLIK